ncbi:hypothetical protein SAMN04488591_0754 [Microbacterium azadirachtae]|uniref:N-acetyltransferase domain-containing protein n=1 Tax=Microbacterium azadirachtae TaxID=582680 RepID=A0A1I6G4Q5_9MICO|nr:hypothetical protein SAMN04488591_0754 [Microbacterium azadirachtae]
MIRLAKKHKQTLGFLPDAVFRDAAMAGNLALAVTPEGLLGYTLYRITRSVVKLTHVCVATEARGQQIGRRLIDHVIEEHPEATSVMASCRRDYQLDSFWTSVGLSPSAEKAGRNAQGLPLTLWVRQLGAPDLFTTSVLSSTRPLAVLDSNIIIDLYSSDTAARPHRESSQELMADWLAEEVEFAVSVQLDHELNDNADAAERVRQSTASQEWVRLPTGRPHDHTTETALRERFGVKTIARDPSLDKDIRHLSDAIRASAKYFVTNDGGVLRARHWLRETYGLAAVRPHELISSVLSASGAVQTFTPGVFEHIDLRWIAATEFDETLLETSFLNYAEHEKARVFRPRLRAALAAGHGRILMDHQEPQALVVGNPLEGELAVPLLRVSTGLHRSSIALQLARQLRLDALSAGKRTVRVTDSMLPAELQGALREDGYELSEDGSLIAQPIDQRGTPNEVDFLTAESIPGTETSAWHRQVEWKHWPLKIWDDIPCYVVPIRPNAAMDLFAYPPNLLQQKRALGLSRRHIYYRSGHTNPFRRLPARVLWYASQNKNQPVQRFFAVSLAVASYRLDAVEAHARFSSLGVYKRSQVLDAADRQGRVTVLEVEDTEVLANPVSLEHFRRIAAPHGVRGEFISPRAIPATLFRLLMEESDRARKVI